MRYNPPVQRTTINQQGKDKQVNRKTGKDARRK